MRATIEHFADRADYSFLEKHFDTYNEYDLASWRAAMSKAPTPRKDTHSILQALADAVSQNAPRRQSQQQQQQQPQQHTQPQQQHHGQTRSAKKQGNAPDVQ
jgi:hypothetical protein